MVNKGNATIVCVSCNNTYAGNYCINCGEKKVNRKERTFKYFIGQLLNAITFSDTKMLRSMWLLLFKPGFLAKEYIEGRRTLYTRPIALFFIINLIYFLAQPVDTFYTGIGSQTTHQMYSSYAKEKVIEKMKKEELTAKEITAKYNKAALDYSKTLIILIVFLFSIPLSILFFSKKQLYFNHIIFSLGFTSFLLLGPLIILTALAQILSLVLTSLGVNGFHFDINGSLTSLFLLLLIILYLSVGLKRFYEQKYILVIPKAIVLAFSSIAVVIAYRFLMFLFIMRII